MINFMIFVLIGIGVFFLMLAFLELGRWFGRHQIKHNPDGARVGTGVIDSAVFALLGLLIAFTFSGAAGRYDYRRHLVLGEANAIGTAWLRIDMMPAGDQPVMRDFFRQYLDARLEAYDKVGGNNDAAWAAFSRSHELQGKIWGHAIAVSNSGGSNPMTMQLLPALNQMFDIGTDRQAILLYHTPLVLYVMLFSLSLLGAMLAGYGLSGSKKQNWLYSIGFAFIISIAFYLILDLEFPSKGLIQMHHADQTLVELRQSMK